MIVICIEPSIKSSSECASDYAILLLQNYSNKYARTLTHRQVPLIHQLTMYSQSTVRATLNGISLRDENDVRMIQKQ